MSHKGSPANNDVKLALRKVQGFTQVLTFLSLEQAVAEEQARIAHEKELEVARLRARQEKVADRRSEIDELRARR